jgi:hypothetical protein
MAFQAKAGSRFARPSTLNLEENVREGEHSTAVVYADRFIPDDEKSARERPAKLTFRPDRPDQEPRKLTFRSDQKPGASKQPRTIVATGFKTGSRHQRGAAQDFRRCGCTSRVEDWRRRVLTIERPIVSDVCGSRSRRFGRWISNTIWPKSSVTAAGRLR